MKKTKPEEFAKLLHESSLPEEKRRIVLENLQYMTPEKREEAANILREDVKEVKKVHKRTEAKQDKIVMKMAVEAEAELKKLRKEQKAKQ